SPRPLMAASCRPAPSNLWCELASSPPPRSVSPITRASIGNRRARPATRRPKTSLPAAHRILHVHGSEAACDSPPASSWPALTSWPECLPSEQSDYFRRLFRSLAKPSLAMPSVVIVLSKVIVPPLCPPFASHLSRNRRFASRSLR